MAPRPLLDILWATPSLMKMTIKHGTLARENAPHTGALFSFYMHMLFT